jgi:hypothetical protein
MSHRGRQRAGVLGDTAARVAEHLRAHAADHFPELVGGPVVVRLLRADSRPYSGLLEFAVGDGERPRRVLVKLAGDGAADGRNGGVEDRPRLVPVPEPGLACLLERGALSRIEAHFRGLGDPRFGAIRVLGALPDRPGFMMERVEEPSLRALLMPRGAGRTPPDRLDAAHRNAGAWVRSYQGIRGPHPATERHARPAELVDFIDEVAGYLGSRLGRPAWLARLAARVRTEAGAVLPDPLPLGLSHGDFAPRNILVNEDGRVTVCDTRARWRTAIYEDLGHFLTSLRYGWVRLYSGGMTLRGATVDRFEREFLAGYFGEANIPRQAIRLYEILALLDRTAWIAAERDRSASRRRRLGRTVQLALLTRAIADLANRPVAGRAWPRAAVRVPTVGR